MGRERSGKKTCFDKKYHRKRQRFYQCTTWYIYTAAFDLKEPFSLEELQDSIFKKSGVRPRIEVILKKSRNFYDENDISLINRVEPSEDAFTVNRGIDLSNESYKAIIPEPKKGRGRPRIRPDKDSEYERKYDRNLRYIRRNPERYLEQIFDQEKNNSAIDIVNQLADMAEGVVFGTRFVEGLLNEYIADVRGPPFLREVEPGMYRRVVKQTAVKYAPK